MTMVPGSWFFVLGRFLVRGPFSVLGTKNGRGTSNERNTRSYLGRTKDPARTRNHGPRTRD
jgi:hypothetical protein